jgi:Cysteine-rich secretory protein family
MVWARSGLGLLHMHDLGFVASVAVCSAALLAGSGSSATGANNVIDKAQILALHNRYRAEVGVPPLRWSDKLAAGAEKWAMLIAGLNRIQHSETSGIGENLAFSTGRNPTPGGMMAFWIKEKDLFSRGVFPQVSRDGNWLSVSHYSQMIWRSTTEVGCGKGNNGSTNFLVCWYSPEGNFAGQTPY